MIGPIGFHKKAEPGADVHKGMCVKEKLTGSDLPSSPSFLLFCMWGILLFECPYGDTAFLQKPLFSSNLNSVFMSLYTNRVRRCDSARPEQDENPHTPHRSPPPFPQRAHPYSASSYQGSLCKFSLHRLEQFSYCTIALRSRLPSRPKGELIAE